MFPRASIRAVSDDNRYQDFKIITKLFQTFFIVLLLIFTKRDITMNPLFINERLMFHKRYV